MKRISVTESVDKKRRIYPIDSEIVFSYIGMYFLSLVLPVGSVLVLISDIQHNRDLVLPVYIIMILIDLWMLGGLYFTNKLYNFRGKTLAAHKNEVISALINYYPDTEFSSGNPMLIRGEKKLGWLKERTRIVTIILADDGIYVNILNTFRGENFSPIQGVYNYFRSRALAKDIYNNILINDQISTTQV